MHLDSLLQDILSHKRKVLKTSMKRRPEKELLKMMQKGPPPFPLKFNRRHLSLIAEIKPASPVAGTFRSIHHGAPIALSYQEGGASAISVLTEEKFFKGSPSILTEAKRAVRIPVMRKDFIFHSYQILESRAMMADGLLLIVRLLKDAELKNLLQEAKSLGMFVLVETFDEEDIDRALESGAEMIGINSRNLQNFSIDPDRFSLLSERITDEKMKIAESGIRSIEDIKVLRRLNFHGALIGEVLMRSRDPSSLLKEFKNASES